MIFKVVIAIVTIDLCNILGYIYIYILHAASVLVDILCSGIERLNMIERVLFGQL